MKLKRLVPNAPAAAVRMRPAEFRHAIAAAEADGVAREAMVLRLTLRDDAELKRDPAVGLDEIRFADGEMRFLGVRVVVGGVPVSTLDRGEK
jgi:hypothetical protein